MPWNRTPQILFIDAYDSFSHNIIALLKKFSGANIVSIKIDDAGYTGENVIRFFGFLKHFDAVIAGPGPGSPSSPEDVGLIDLLWDLEEAKSLPILGICLGFQSLARAYGAKIERVDRPEHGIVTQIFHERESIFDGLGDIYATQYNSLQAIQIEDTPSTILDGEIINESRLQNSSPNLQRIAWSFGKAGNGPILMGIKHVKKPLWGIQYHPESICTNTDGAKVVKNWWMTSCRWNTAHRRNPKPFPSSQFPQSIKTTPWMKDNNYLKHRLERTPSRQVHWMSCPFARIDVSILCEALQLHHGDFVLLESGTNEHGVPLNPETGRFSIIGCIMPEKTERFEYYLASRRMIRTCGKNILSVETVDQPWTYLGDYMKFHRAQGGPLSLPFWGGLVGYYSYEAGVASLGIYTASKVGFRPDASFMYVQRSIVIDHLSEEAFIQSTCEDDTKWILGIKGVLNGLVIAQRNWTATRTTKQCLHTKASCPSFQSHSVDESIHPFINSGLNHSDRISLVFPAKSNYISKVHRCLSSIRAGDAYELCLTAKTKIHVPFSLAKTIHQPWHLYKRLRLRNPAPFGAFFRLSSTFQSRTDSGITILSSSPERFVRWSRPTYAPRKSQNGPRMEKKSTTIQFRPIKGTVSKSHAPTRALAEEILKSPKEMAENLMIVDLIRHDLSGVLTGPDDEVRVAKLMVVEEYATLWQLVSVIEGIMRNDLQSASALKPEGLLEANSSDFSNTENSYGKSQPVSRHTSGIDVLAASLPPGSMTGAPKRRSCEILQRLEGSETRGIYSGILGYLDVGGGGDFSVVIRTAWRWDDDTDVKVNEGKPIQSPGEADHVWSLAAGGAVTIQSDPEAEYEEMKAKRDALIGIFGEFPDHSSC